MSSAKPINRSPLFESAEGWGPGYAVAKGEGPGVVVGPGSGSPNVFTQSFQRKTREQFKVTARASSVDKEEGSGLIQINWYNREGKYLSSSMQYFKVTQQETTFHYDAVPPRGARQGVLYVVPGGPGDIVRYTEMSVYRLGPLDDFTSYRFAGVTGQNLLVSLVAILALVVLYARFRKQVSRLAAYSAEAIIRIFPLLALLLCAGMFIFMEGFYEQHYDSQVHQGSIETVMRWNDLSLDLRGGALHHFGIQDVQNAQLSPAFWLGSVVPADHRVQVQAAFQAIALFAMLFGICRLSGARMPESAAISLIAVFYLWIPDLTDHAVTLDATLGLLWQEGLLASLFAFLCFALIGYRGLQGVSRLWPVAGFILTIVWFAFAWPELIAFFALATSGLCLGALLGVQSRTELLQKASVAAALSAFLLLAGFHDYILNLFLYTPQMYYKTLYNHNFEALFFGNTSLLLSARQLGGGKLVAFFVFAGIGAYWALRFGNGFTRRIVFGALALEATVHLASAINWQLKLVPLTFTYVELMGLAVVALLAGTGVWATLRLTVFVLARGYELAGFALSAARKAFARGAL